MNLFECMNVTKSDGMSERCEKWRDVWTLCLFVEHSDGHQAVRHALDQQSEHHRVGRTAADRHAL